MEFMGIAGVAAISVICYVIGEGVKLSPMDNKFIPAICGVCGGLLGLAAMFLMADFPAGDYITAIAVGMVSGLAATGAYELKANVNK